MSQMSLKSKQAALRKKRVRSKVVGTPARPRLSVTISHLHVSAQIIDDSSSKTLAHATTIGNKMKGNLTDKSAFIGKEIGLKAKQAKIKRVVLDRNGRRYQARLSALGEALRQEGIEV